VLQSEAQAASTQGITLWQQATIEITPHAHFIIACSHHMHRVLFLGHIPFVGNGACDAAPTDKPHHSVSDEQQDELIDLQNDFTAKDIHDN